MSRRDCGDFKIKLTRAIKDVMNTRFAAKKIFLIFVE